MLPRNRQERPAANRALSNVNYLDTSTLLELADNAEHTRRARLVHDLHRLAVRLDRLDRPAAELARHFAEVAA